MEKETYEKMIISTDAILLFGFSQSNGIYKAKRNKIIYTLEMMDETENENPLTKKEVYLLKHFASIYFHKLPKANKGKVYISCSEIWDSMNGGASHRGRKGKQFIEEIRAMLTKLSKRRIRLKRNKVPTTKKGIEADKNYSKLLRDIDTNLIIAKFDNIHHCIELLIKDNDFLNIAQKLYKNIPYTLFNADNLARMLNKRSIDATTQNIAISIVALLIMSVEKNYKKISYQKISERAGYSPTYDYMEKSEKQKFRALTGALMEAIITLSSGNSNLYDEYPYLKKIGQKTFEEWVERNINNRGKGYIIAQKTTKKNVT